MKRFILVLALSLAAAGCQRSQPAASSGVVAPAARNGASAPNAYAAGAVNLWLGPASAVSPDGQFAVQLDRSLADAEPDGRPAPLVNIIANGEDPFPVNLISVVGAEVLWAPDSNTVAISSNDSGGDAGPYSLTLVLRRHLSSGWRQENLSPMIAQAYGAPNRCVQPQATDAAAVAWLANDRILIAAQTPSGANCDSAGTFRTFEYDLTAGRVVTIHDQLESKRLFGPKLGVALVAANDACINTPSACEVGAMHLDPETPEAPAAPAR